jgi:hypothetical protein
LEEATDLSQDRLLLDLNLNHIRRETSRHYRNKKREYLKDKIDELATNSKNKNIETCIEGSITLRGLPN